MKTIKIIYAMLLLTLAISTLSSCGSKSSNLKDKLVTTKFRAIDTELEVTIVVTLVHLGVPTLQAGDTVLINPKTNEIVTTPFNKDLPNNYITVVLQ